MSERSFVEIWSLAFDDVSSIEGFNRSSRIWVAFQLRFCRLSAEDYRGLTPLIYSHINPYGRYDIDWASRIDFDRQAA